MELKKELYNLLVSYGLTDIEIEEFVSKLQDHANSYIKAKEDAERQLQFNEDVKKGLEATIIDAQERYDRAQSLVNKVAEVPVVEVVTK